MNTKVNNAVIMAAGLSSRFAPISYEMPKGLIKVRGEVLIERQIKQLKEVGINDIIIVVGYKKEMFYYLEDKFKVKIIENPDYNTRNNNSTLYVAREFLGNTYICSADNYFTTNVFEKYAEESFYSAVFDEGDTKEWCIYTDSDKRINGVKIGGCDEWVMLGHAYFNYDFANKFKNILVKVYDNEETKPLLWESIFLNHISELEMYIKKFDEDVIFEFDTLDELRDFDETYKNQSGSIILKDVCQKLNCNEVDIVEATPISAQGEIIGFYFKVGDYRYSYLYEKKELGEIGGKTYDER